MLIFISSILCRLIWILCYVYMYYLIYVLLYLSLIYFCCLLYMLLSAIYVSVFVQHYIRGIASKERWCLPHENFVGKWLFCVLAPGRVLLQPVAAEVAVEAPVNVTTGVMVASANGPGAVSDPVASRRLHRSSCMKTCAKISAIPIIKYIHTGFILCKIIFLTSWTYFMNLHAKKG